MKRWSAKQASAYMAKRPWPVGCNYTPAYASNQIEYWDNSLFDEAAIGRELDLAAGLGFNTLRVYLHDLCFAAEGPAYFERIARFLDLAAARGQTVLPVIFDSCWHPFPRPGRQREPEPGVHNAGWVQSPGVAVLRDRQRFAALEPYVRGLVARFRDEARIIAWDIWNEPDNQNRASRFARDLMAEKAAIVEPLLVQAFAWARTENPSQPLTSAVWTGEWSQAGMTSLMHTQCDLSDLISFHWYGARGEAAERVAQLRRYGRPLLCTEFLARPHGNDFHEFLPFLKDEGIAAYCWGLVNGRTQTHLPWSTWQAPSERDPEPWFHDLFHADGRPWSAAEAKAIRRLTGKKRA